jgi:hypothetical protein
MILRGAMQLRQRPAGVAATDSPESKGDAPGVGDLSENSSSKTSPSATFTAPLLPSSARFTVAWEGDRGHSSAVHGAMSNAAAEGAERARTHSPVPAGVKLVQEANRHRTG